MEEQLLHPLPCPTADWLAVSHSVSLIHITHVTVTVCRNVWFCLVALFIAEISFLWLFINVSIQMSLLSVYCVVVMSPLVVFWMSSHLSSTVLHLRSSGIPFLVYLGSFSTTNFFSLSSRLEVHGRKVIVLVQFVATSFSFPYYFCHSDMGCCQLCRHALPVLSQAYFCVSSCVICVVWYKNAVLLGNIFSEYIIPLNKTITSVAIFSEGLWNLENFLFRISNMSCISHSLSQFPSFVSTPSLLYMKCRNGRMCKYLFHFIMLVRMECKTSLFLPISLSVGFISNVPFVLLLPETQTFQPQLLQVGEKVPHQECPCTSDIC